MRLTHVVLSYGTPLSELYTRKDGKPTARKPIQEFALDKWFFKEELYRSEERWLRILRASWMRTRNANSC